MTDNDDVTVTDTDTDTSNMLDARGLMCPEPIRLAETRIREIDAGATLRILASDPAAPLDFEAWCLRRGHRYLGCSRADDTLDIRVCKGRDADG